MSILNKQWILEVIQAERSKAITILRQEGATWGPKWVTGGVKVPGLEEVVDFEFSGYTAEKWDSSKWGDPYTFLDMVSKNIANPQCLNEGEYPCFGGTVHREDITVSVAGGNGNACRQIAEIIHANIVSVCQKTGTLSQ